MSYDLFQLTQLAYRAYEQRDKIEQLDAKLKPHVDVLKHLLPMLEPYFDMLKRDLPVLIPLAKEIYAGIFPDAASAPTPKRDVRWIQTALNRTGDVRPVKVDGDLGNETRQAIKDFQAKHGLVVDGWVGPGTMPVLEALSQ